VLSVILYLTNSSTVTKSFSTQKITCNIFSLWLCHGCKLENVEDYKPQKIFNSKKFEMSVENDKLFWHKTLKKRLCLHGSQSGISFLATMSSISQSVSQSVTFYSGHRNKDYFVVHWNANRWKIVGTVRSQLIRNKSMVFTLVPWKTQKLCLILAHPSPLRKDCHRVLNVMTCAITA